jgi:acylaminoacyl-peptidase
MVLNLDLVYEKLLKVSPVYYVKDKVSPALLMIGECDRRVPPSQGYRWAEYLKAKKQTIRVLSFPQDGHALDSVDAERVSFEASAIFFMQLTN